MDFWANFAELKTELNTYDWEKEFPEIMQAGGFHVVIGNPPYLNITLISERERAYFISNFISLMMRFDAYGLFIERGINLLVDGAKLGMIVPSTLLNNLTFRNLRKMILDLTNPILIVNLGGKVFQKVNNDTLIIMLRKGKSWNDLTTIFDVNEYGSKLDSARKVATVDLNSLCKPPEYEFAIHTYNKKDSFIIEKSSHMVHIGDVCDYFQGFVTGDNHAYRISPEELIEQQLESEICKPSVSGNEISRYGKTDPKSLVIYLTKKHDLSKFPNIEKRLDHYKDKLSKKREVREGKQPWYSLHWPRNQADFERNEKILVQKIRNLSLPRRIVATLDENKIFADSTINVFYPRDERYNIRYILGVLNSSLMNKIFKDKYLDITIKGAYISDIPLRAIDFADPQDVARHDHMVSLVDSMLSLHKQLQEARTPHEQTALQRHIEATDRQIDALVYELYGLTEEEIRIVEGIHER